MKIAANDVKGILKGDYQELLDVIAYEIHLPTFALHKPPLPLDLPPPPPLPSCGGGWSRSGGAIRYLKPGIYLSNAEEFASRKEREKDSYRASYLLFLNLFSWDTSYGLQTTIPSTRLKSLSLVAISRIRQRLIADR